MKKQVIIVIALLLVASTSEFLWMDVVSGKKYLLETETEKEAQFEDKSTEPTTDIKSNFSGSDDCFFSLQSFEGTLSLAAATSEMRSQLRILQSPKLYLLFCQLRHHILM